LLSIEINNNPKKPIIPDIFNLNHLSCKMQINDI